MEPSGNSVGDIHVSLAWFVDPGRRSIFNRRIETELYVYALVETVCVGSITGLGVLQECGNTAWVITPEHDADVPTGALDQIGNYDIPEMEHYDTRGGEEKIYSLIITHSPSDGKFPRTRRGCGWGIGWAGTGGDGARRARRGGVRRGRRI